MWTPAPIARSTMRVRRPGAGRSSPSKGVTKMPEMPVRAVRSFGSIEGIGSRPSRFRLGGGYSLDLVFGT
jgi:hypothetical protein